MTKFSTSLFLFSIFLSTAKADDAGQRYQVLKVIAKKPPQQDGRHSLLGFEVQVPEAVEKQRKNEEKSMEWRVGSGGPLKFEFPPTDFKFTKDIEVYNTDLDDIARQLNASQVQRFMAGWERERPYDRYEIILATGLAKLLNIEAVALNRSFGIQEPLLRKERLQFAIDYFSNMVSDFFDDPAKIRRVLIKARKQIALLYWEQALKKYIFKKDDHDFGAAAKRYLQEHKELVIDWSQSLPADEMTNRELISMGRTAFVIAQVDEALRKAFGLDFKTPVTEQHIEEFLKRYADVVIEWNYHSDNLPPYMPLRWKQPLAISLEQFEKSWHAASGADRQKAFESWLKAAVDADIVQNPPSAEEEAAEAEYAKVKHTRFEPIDYPPLRKANPCVVSFDGITPEQFGKTADRIDAAIAAQFDSEGLGSWEIYYVYLLMNREFKIDFGSVTGMDRDIQQKLDADAWPEVAVSMRGRPIPTNDQELGDAMFDSLNLYYFQRLYRKVVFDYGQLVSRKYELRMKQAEEASWPDIKAFYAENPDKFAAMDISWTAISLPAGFDQEKLQTIYTEELETARQYVKKELQKIIDEASRRHMGDTTRWNDTGMPAIRVRAAQMMAKNIQARIYEGQAAAPKNAPHFSPMYFSTDVSWDYMIQEISNTLAEHAEYVTPILTEYHSLEAQKREEFKKAGIKRAISYYPELLPVAPVPDLDPSGATTLILYFMIHSHGLYEMQNDIGEFLSKRVRLEANSEIVKNLMRIGLEFVPSASDWDPLNISGADFTSISQERERLLSMINGNTYSDLIDLAALISHTQLTKSQRWRTLAMKIPRPQDQPTNFNPLSGIGGIRR